MALQDETAHMTVSNNEITPPPSLKQQALALIDECTDPHGDYLDDNALSIIRRALEALPE
jgi:hypothetical protein